jgi:hypothetical protein
MMSTMEKSAVRPEPGTTIRVQAPGRRHPVDYVVVPSAIIEVGGTPAIRAARPSRKHPGDFFGGVHTILLDWIIPTCNTCGGDCQDGADAWWVCTVCGDEWNADHDPQYVTA